MSFRNLVIALTFLAIFFMALRFSVDTDTWWHLATGETILREGSIPHTDSFSFTRLGAEWRYPSTAWLSEIQLYAIMATTGPGGLNIWTAALVTLAFAFIYKSLSGGLFLRAFTLVFAAVVSGVYWAARPYMVSFVLAAVFIWILEDFRWRRNNRLIWMPALMVLWVNSHPGFGIGFFLVAIYALDEGTRWLLAKWGKKKAEVAVGRKRLGNFAWMALGLLVAASINPSGPALLTYPFETVSIGVLRDLIQEWQSPNFHLLQMQPFAWLLLLTLGVLGASRMRVAFSDFLLVAVFGFLGLLAGRNIPLFALVAPIVLTRYADPLITEVRKQLGLAKAAKSKPFKGQALLNTGILAALLLAVFVKAVIVFPAEANWREIESHMPLGAARYIDRENPPGQIFNSYNWGGFLIWELNGYPVFVDGRTDLYGDDVLREWLSIANAEEGWQAKLESRDVHLVLLEPSWPLTKVLAYEGWQLLYEDKISVLYGR